MPAKGEEVHGAEDGTPSGSQSPGGGDVPVSGGRPVQPNRVPAAREEEASRQRMGSGVCVHHDVRATCRIHGHVLHRQLPHGAQTVHGPEGDTHEVPVGQGRAVGVSSQTGLHMRLQGSHTMGRKKGHRMDIGGHRRSTLQC
jgi:hypothetical protein